MPTDVPLSDLHEHADSPGPPSTPPDLLIVLGERKHIIFWVTAVFAIIATVNSLIVPKGQMTTDAPESVSQLHYVKHYETIFDILTREFELAKLDVASEGELIQVVDPADPRYRISFPNRSPLGAGLVIGVFTASVLRDFESLKYKLDSAAKRDFLRGVLFFLNGMEPF